MKSQTRIFGGNSVFHLLKQPEFFLVAWSVRRKERGFSVSGFTVLIPEISLRKTKQKGTLKGQYHEISSMFLCRLH